MEKFAYVTLKKLMQEFLLEEIDCTRYDSSENECMRIIERVNEKIRESERKENE